MTKSGYLATSADATRVRSGDVDLFCRTFGKRGATPLLIMHGANYFDSFDWIDVAAALSADREVVAFDQRGFGESGWSPSKNYSVDALMGDISAVIDHFGWSRPIVMGHSASGRLAVSFASNFPSYLSQLVIVDSSFAHEGGGGRGPSVGNPPVMFASVDAAMSRFAKLSNPPRIASDRARAEQALVQTPDGWQLKRDPDYQNAAPINGDASVRPRRELDVWEELGKVRCPTLIVRGVKSDRFTDDIIVRIRSARPDFIWADANSQHDVAFGAPQDLVAAVQHFIVAD